MGGRKRLTAAARGRERASPATTTTGDVTMRPLITIPSADELRSWTRGPWVTVTIRPPRLGDSATSDAVTDQLESE